MTDWGPVALGLALLAAPPAALANGPAHVEVVERDGAAVLLRDGAPYFIKGAGGDGSLDALVKAGANSLRTWSAGPETAALLDRAHALGLTVTVGLWLGHPRHGFDYSDARQVAVQLGRARASVLALKDHPALLMWGVGNEMEGFERGDDPHVWRAVNDVARMIEALDPHHPTMVVTAEIGGARVAMINTHCPAVDVHGINSYGGLPTLPARYRAAGGVKPTVVTEFGPPGTWEVGRDALGAPREPTSTEKAAAYRHAYQAGVLRSGGRGLGAYVFFWGAKREATATWFGMFLPDGTKLAPVDVMTQLWRGAPPANRCPTLTPVAVEGALVVPPGGRVTAKVRVADSDGDAVAVSWTLRSEAATYQTGGDAQPPTRAWPEAIVEAEAGRVVVQLPRGGGLYRLYAVARDGRGGAAVANLPLKVDGPTVPPPPARATLPLVVYGDGVRDPPWAASGWMGQTDAIAMDPASTERPALGKTCLRVDFRAPGGWAGVAWQSPANDWGDKPGGWDLRGARTLSFWARGARGGEKVKLLVGLIGADKPFPDSGKRELEVTLGFRWQRYFMDLRGLDLRRIKTGFGWVVSGQGAPLTFYLDDIRYQ